MRSRTRTLAALLVPALLALAPAPAASAADQVHSPQPVPPGCELDCPPPPTYQHEATLTVSRTVGTVTSDTFGGHAISCGTTCSVTDTQATEDPTFPADGWHTYTLAASGGPLGYTASWSGCDGGGHLGGTCAVTNDSETGTTAALTWVDTTAPSVSFSPPAKVGPGNYNVTAGSGDNSGFVAAYAWTVDNVAQGSTGSVLSLSAMAQGAHVVSVRSRDAAGNWSGWVSKTVTVDKSVAVQVDEVAAYVAAPPAVGFTKDADVVTTTCSVAPQGSGHTPAACSSPWSVPGPLADGAYEIRVAVTDDVGNTTSVTRQFTLDTGAPVVAVEGPADGSTQSASGATFALTASDAALDTVVCTLDALPLDCASGAPVQLTGLAAGAHTFAVTATDLAGNATVVSRTFTRRVPTSLTARAKDQTVRRGQRVTLVATGLPAGATGTVVFTGNGTRLCTATVDGGRASCRTSTTLRPARYDAKAAYRGAVGYAPSSDTFWFKVVR